MARKLLAGGLLAVLLASVAVAAGLSTSDQTGNIPQADRRDVAAAPAADAGTATDLSQWRETVVIIPGSTRKR